MTVQLLYYNQTTLNNYQVNIIIKLTRQFSNVSVQVSIGLRQAYEFAFVLQTLTYLPTYRCSGFFRSSSGEFMA